jgi:predicted signal transduction protein with EAL and GGDEF domain
MDEIVRQRAQFESDLWTAIRNDEITPHFQPLVHLRDGKPRGYEILARWTHPTRGPIPPDQFIPVAEASGAIADMTMNLFHKACREAANLEGAPHLSLNVSPLMLHDDQLAQKLLRIMEEHSFAPQRLEIELTEAALVTDIAAARAILMALREHGVRIALDNFGTGHASLTQLRLLPFDKLKIDRSFVRRMTPRTPKPPPSYALPSPWRGRWASSLSLKASRTRIRRACWPEWAATWRRASTSAAPRRPSNSAQ